MLLRVMIPLSRAACFENLRSKIDQETDMGFIMTTQAERNQHAPYTCHTPRTRHEGQTERRHTVSSCPLHCVSLTTPHQFVEPVCSSVSEPLASHGIPNMSRDAAARAYIAAQRTHLPRTRTVPEAHLSTARVKGLKRAYGLNIT
jgi:O-acetyl-ADP-ribose deacetylase (regulator of RNase III)